MLSGGAVNAEPGGVNNAPGLALVDVLFGSRGPRFAPAPRPGSSQGLWTPLNPGLDASQVAAVELALRAQDVALIHGPPGRQGLVADVLCVSLSRVPGRSLGVTCGVRQGEAYETKHTVAAHLLTPPHLFLCYALLILCHVTM